MWLVVSNIFIFHSIWDNPSHWLIFLKIAKATNQTYKTCFLLMLSKIPHAHLMLATSNWATAEPLRDLREGCGLWRWVERVGVKSCSMGWCLPVISPINQSSWSCKPIWLTIRHHPDWRGNPAYPCMVCISCACRYNRPRRRLVWPGWLIFLALPELDELEWLHIMTSLEWWHPYYVNYNDLTATSL